jgi:hypothetical protein
MLGTSWPALQCILCLVTHRYEEFQRADAVNSSQGLVHNLCATASSNGPLLWACSGAGTASIYSIQGKGLVRKVRAAGLLAEVHSTSG